MRLVPTPQQEDLRSVVRDFCAREVTPDRLRAWERAPDAEAVEVASQVAALGWYGLGLPTAAGGGGAPLVDVAWLVAEAARGLVPRSVLGAIRRATALAHACPGASVLPALASGDNGVAFAIEEEDASKPRGWSTVVVPDEAGTGHVRGRKAYVVDASTSEIHLVATRHEGSTRLVLVDATADSTRTDELHAFGGDRQAHVDYVGAPVLEDLGQGDELLSCLRQAEQALALAEMLGGMDAVLETSVAYVKEREQFGQKIALFQAVRHQIADMGIRFTAARHLGWRAISRVSNGTLAGSELATALAYGARAFRELCFTGHHLHGGAGYVLEHPLHLHSERAQSLSIRYAPEAPALAEVAAALLD